MSPTPPILSPAQRKKLARLSAQRQRLEDRIGMLMSQRVELDERMAAVYDQGKGR